MHSLSEYNDNFSKARFGVEHAIASNCRPLYPPLLLSLVTSFKTPDKETITKSRPKKPIQKISKHFL